MYKGASPSLPWLTSVIEIAIEQLQLKSYMFHCQTFSYIN